MSFSHRASQARPRAAGVRQRVSKLLLGACLGMAPWLAQADSWKPASTQVVSSADNNTRVTIEPRQLSSSRTFFSDMVEGKENAGQLEGGREQAAARVERKDANGLWQLLWQGPLVNEVAPVESLISNGGRYLVTLDNWHAMGFGSSAVVIYDDSGQRLHQLSLRQILPRDYVTALPRSVSSLHWRGDAALSQDGNALEIQLLVPGEDFDEPQFLPLRIDLADARVTLPRGPAWKKAMQLASAEVAELRAEHEAFERSHSAPLPAPTDASTKAWEAYAREVMIRLDVLGEVKILAAADASDRLSSRQTLASLLQQIGDPASLVSRTRTWTLASPDPHELEAVVTQSLSELAPGSAGQQQVIFIGLPEQQARVSDLFKTVGAELRFVDMSQPVPGITKVPFEALED